MPSALKSRTTYTIEESQAWRHYPYAERIKPASSLSHALRLYRQRFDPNEACQAEVHARRRAEQCAARKRRYEQLATLPELCYKDEHPMRAAAGRDKLYDKQRQRVRPICDSITVMYDKLGGAVGGGGASDAFGLFGGRAQDTARAPTSRTGTTSRRRPRSEAVARRSGRVRRGELTRRSAGGGARTPSCATTRDVGLAHRVRTTGACCPCGTMVRGATHRQSARPSGAATPTTAPRARTRRKKRAETGRRRRSPWRSATSSTARRRPSKRRSARARQAACRRRQEHARAHPQGVNGRGLCRLRRRSGGGGPRARAARASRS